MLHVGAIPEIVLRVGAQFHFEVLQSVGRSELCSDRNKGSVVPLTDRTSYQAGVLINRTVEQRSTNGSHSDDHPNRSGDTSQLRQDNYN